MVVEQEESNRLHVDRAWPEPVQAVVLLLGAGPDGPVSKLTLTCTGGPVVSEGVARQTRS